MRQPIRLLAAMLLGCLAAVSLTGLPARAVEPDEILSDPALEARARKLSAELRCLVCQNQSIDDSNAPLAKDLRLIVRERLKAGDNDEGVLKYVVARYGEFVLLRPVMGLHTLILWLTPLAILLLGGFLFHRTFSTRAASAGGPAPADAKLSAEEERRLAAVLKDKSAG